MNCFGGFNILTSIIMNVITSILYTNQQPDLSGALFCHCDRRNIQFFALTLFAMSKKAGTEGGQSCPNLSHPDLQMPVRPDFSLDIFP